MAIDKGEVTLSNLKKTNRTWRTTIETPFGGASNWLMRIHREDFIYNDVDGSLISKENTNTVNRNFLNVMSEQVVLASDPSITITVAQIAEAIEIAVDKWKLEDLAAAEDIAE